MFEKGEMVELKISRHLESGIGRSWKRVDTDPV